MVVVPASSALDVINFTAPNNAPSSEFPVLPVSILVATGGQAALPSAIAIANSTLIVSGTICGVNTVSVLDGGELGLGVDGSTCSAGIGHYSFDAVLVYTNGNLTNSTISPPTIDGPVCAFDGSSVVGVVASSSYDSQNLGRCLFC